MRDYAIVLPDFWIGATGRALRTKDPSVRELAFYLFSAPNSSMYGLYYKPPETMVLETGRKAGVIQQALVALQELNYCAYDTRTDFVWVFEMAEIQLRPLPLRTGDYKIAAATKWYQTVTKNPFLGPFYDKYSEKLRFDCGRRNEVQVTPREHTVQEGTVAPPLISTSISTSVSIPDLVVTDSGFEQFWNAYPHTRRVGKKAARAEWKKIAPDDRTVAQIVQAVERQRRTTQWLKEGGQFVPHPERYLKHRRWEDEDSEGPVVGSKTLNMMKAALEFAAEGGDDGQSGPPDLFGEADGTGDLDGAVSGVGEAGNQGLLGRSEGHPTGRDRDRARRGVEGLRTLPGRR